MTGVIYDLYHPPGLPTQVFVGPDGAVRSFVLAPLTMAGAIAQVEAILPPSASAAPSLSLSGGASLAPAPTAGPSPSGPP